MSKTIPSTDPQLPILRKASTKDFAPFYTPNDMLDLGVFGGSFFSPNRAKKIIENVLGYEQFMDLTMGINISKFQSGEYDPTQNYFPNQALSFTDRWFGMPADQKRKHKYGWFHWYVLFYYGEQSVADAPRVMQWKKAINVNWFYIASTPYTGEGNRNTDLTFLPTRRQRLLELGWDPTVDPATKGLKMNF